MPTDEIQPNISLKFILKNLGTIIKMKRANINRMDKFVRANQNLIEPIMPTTEGTGGPMEEGMIYVIFNSNEESSPELFDSVYRVFWVNAPDLKFSVFDGSLISENLKSGQWDRSFGKAIFENLSKTHFHQEVHFDDCNLEFDGKWPEGYICTFHDKKLDIKGKLEYKAIDPKGVLVYYNNRLTVASSLAERFYDIFAIKVTGIIEAQGKKIQVSDGRGIVEHGLGIFSNFDIYDWRWLNLQFPEGQIHLFYHSLDLGDDGIYEAGEGAALMNGEWYHFQPWDLQINEVAYGEDKDLPTKVPIEWNVIAGKDSDGKPLLNLKMTITTKLSWHGLMAKENQAITNYILNVEGTWNGRPIKGKGTMENQMHRVIK
jgi:hypothetical protein